MTETKDSHETSIQLAESEQITRSNEFPSLIDSSEETSFEPDESFAGEFTGGKSLQQGLAKKPTLTRKTKNIGESLVKDKMIYAISKTLGKHQTIYSIEPDPKIPL